MSMNNFHKNKGIVIELTALLDVIMIMLFWVMMNMSEKTEDANSKAQEEIKAAQQQVMIEKEKAQEQIDSILDDTSRQIAEIKENAENADSMALKNQQALDGYEQGLPVKLSLKFENGEDYLYISKGEDIQTSFTVSGGNLSEQIISAFEQMGLEKDEVILCALVYDGSQVLNRDYNAVANAAQQIREVYGNFYCTYINTTK